VLAAAVRANVEVLVTFNLRDFPAPALEPFDIIAVHPDEFLLDQLDLYPARSACARCPRGDTCGTATLGVPVGPEGAGRRREEVRRDRIRSR
jgi:hypothetical protein